MPTVTEEDDDTDTNEDAGTGEYITIDKTTDVGEDAENDENLGNDNDTVVVENTDIIGNTGEDGDFAVVNITDTDPDTGKHVNNGNDKDVSTAKKLEKGKGTAIVKVSEVDEKTDENTGQNENTGQDETTGNENNTNNSKRNENHDGGSNGGINKTDNWYPTAKDNGNGRLKHTADEKTDNKCDSDRQTPAYYGVMIIHHALRKDKDWFLKQPILRYLFILQYAPSSTPSSSSSSSESKSHFGRRVIDRWKAALKGSLSGKAGAERKEKKKKNSGKGEGKEEKGEGKEGKGKGKGREGSE